MAFVGALGSCLRLPSSRLAGQRFTLLAYRVHNVRSFSLLQRPVLPRNSAARPLPFTSRSITQKTSEVAAVSSTPIDDASTPAVYSATVSPDAVPVEVSEGILNDIANTVTSHLPAAMQYGDLAALGLAGWTPAGIIRWTFEIINVTTGLPWFWTIVAGSLLWRLALVPLSVKSLRNTARLLPLQPQIKKLQGEMEVVRRSGDKLALQRTALKIRKVYGDAGVSMGTTALVPFIQVPVTLGMFFGVKKMCDLPVAQLTQSGLDFLPNLTVADPYMILPVVLCAAVNLQISLGAAEMNLTERPEMGHLMNLFRVLSLASIWIMSAFPSGLMVSLLTTSSATTLQSYLLQRPAIRSYLNIPYVPQEARGKLPSFMESAQFVIAKYRSKVEDAKRQAAEQQKPRRR